MDYIFDITSKKNKATYNDGGALLSNKFKFDGSLEDKAELLKICRIVAKSISSDVESVRYCTKGDKSYTDGRDIVISSSVLPHSYDSTIGLTLHEASHVAITDFDLWVSKLTNTQGKTPSETRLLKDIWNWVEDRRIDGWVYGKYPGHRRYYEALYRRYFLSSVVEEIIQDNAKIILEETINNYMFYLINSINPLIVMDELEGLDEIRTILDIDNITRLKDTAEALEIAEKIYEVIIKHVPQKDVYDINTKNKLDDETSADGLSDSELRELIKDLLGRYSLFGDGEIDDSVVIPIFPSEQSDIDELLSDVVIDIDIHRVDKNPILDDLNLRKTEVEVVKKVTKEAMLNDSSVLGIFGCHSQKHYDAVDRGISIGKKLKNKLSFREEIREIKFANQKNGRLNINKLHQCKTDPEKIFYTKEISKYDTLNLHISVDASYSMSEGSKWVETLTFVSAIATATNGMKDINLQISYRYKRGGTIYCVLIYDSTVDDKDKIKYLRYTTTGGSTPEGLCFSALCDDIMVKYLNKNTIFINFSDGEPDGGYNAVAVTKEMIKFFKKRGIEVLSYFITNSNGSISDTFTDMYGQDSVHLIKSSEMSRLIKTLNNKFLKVGKK